MNDVHIRKATLEDLDLLEDLEACSFPKHRQSNRRSLRSSITNPNQHIDVLERITGATVRALAGSAIVICYRRSVRLYSIAVHPSCRGEGLGDVLLQHVIEMARLRGFERMTLEADCGNTALVAWYQKSSFEIVQRVEDYYGPGEPAFRMVKRLRQEVAGPALSGNVVVVDHAKRWSISVPDVDEVVSAKEYLSAERFRNSERYHVLNLCSSYKTHSMGYYVSLVASARNHRVVPTVMTVKDISNLSIVQSLFEEIREFAQEKLKSVRAETLELPVILGMAAQSEYADLAKKLFALFEIPFFSVTLIRDGTWKIRKLNTLSLSSVLSGYPAELRAAISKHFLKKRYRRTQLKKYRYDLAILVNAEEKTPPSCPVALGKFRKAAEEVGFFVEFIGRADHRRICEFDALFIRETTAIENHTYRLARHAYTEGLVVIDDPWSILFCSNKIYLHERLARGRIQQPKSWLLTKGSITPGLLRTLAFPLVLKLPESSFSLGVYLVHNPTELQDKLKLMLQESDLVIAQEFLASEFDWRIGILDNTPLFACKYYMANGHWQIYNWAHAEHTEFSGNSETIPVNQVPARILRAAVKSSSLIGDGLYGVDLKDVGGQAYVIEINDNPNIDAGIEDALLQDELYLRIMTSIFNRLERERFQSRYLL